MHRHVLKPPSGFDPRKPPDPNETPTSSAEITEDWSKYFDEKLTLDSPYNFKFNVYRKGDKTLPACLFIHGGGFTGLTWSVFTEAIMKLVKVQCIAPDLRGHGLSQSYSTGESDPNFYSLDNFSKDLVYIMSEMPGFKDESKVPPIILFGHSMGGAVASHLANDTNFYQPACLGLFDVIEGSALQALPAMEGVIRSRPSKFQSEQAAVNWATSTGYIKNHKSAAVSMPSQVVKRENQDVFTWRTDLAVTRPFWESWFKGMDKKFLSANCGPKVVLVQDPNNLDREMCIAQMQGKFQIQMLPSSGHAVHEDKPDQIASRISQYLKRFKIAEGVPGADNPSSRRPRIKPYGATNPISE